MTAPTAIDCTTPVHGASSRNAHLTALRVAILARYPGSTVDDYMSGPHLCCVVRVNGQPHGCGLLYVRHNVDGMLVYQSTWGRGQGIALRDVAHLRGVLADVATRLRQGQQRRKDARAAAVDCAATIDARVTAIARRLGWRYVIAVHSHKSVVTVRLDTRYGIDVDVPYAQAHVVLRMLPAVVAMARKLYASNGARVVVAQGAAYRAEHAATRRRYGRAVGTPWRGATNARA